MEILQITNPIFREYGQILKGYDFTEVSEVLRRETEMPTEGIIYEASSPILEALPIYKELRDRGYGGVDIQLGYCNGENYELTCVEYHRGSEMNIYCDDVILLLARQPEIGEDFTFDTSCVRAFFVPAGTGVELYATTLHYAPCCAKPGQGFRVACTLPHGTNVGSISHDADEPLTENRLLYAANKWLITREGTPEAASGAHVGFRGPDIRVGAD